jgi:hypothetical protein
MVVAVDAFVDMLLVYDVGTTAACCVEQCLVCF